MSPVIEIPLTNKVPFTVNPVTVLIVALYVPPVASKIVKVLLLYVNADIPVPTPPPPTVNNLQLDRLVPPLTFSIVEPVQAFINDCPATLFALTIVPNCVCTTVGPPTPVDPVAAFHNVL